MVAKKYAQVVGVALLIIAAVGLVLGEGPLLGILNIDLQEDMIHFFSGGLLAYVGFAKSEKIASPVVGALSVVYLLVGLIGVVSPGFYGILQHEYSLLDNLIHLSLGVIGLAVYFMSSGKKHPELT